MIEPILGSVYTFKWHPYEGSKKLTLTGVAVKIRPGRVFLRTKGREYNIPQEDLIDGPLPPLKESAYDDD